MTAPYTIFQYRFPPRTHSKIPYTDSPVLNLWKGFPDSVAQYKLDGINTQIVVHPDRSIKLWTRHKDPVSKQPIEVANFSLPDSLRARILSLTPKNNFTIYNAELLHHKTTMVKNTLYFFDVLVWNGQYLLNVNYSQRHEIIWKALEGKKMPLYEEKIDGELFVAHNIPAANWDNAWASAKTSLYCEGLVLKRTGPVSSLKIGYTERNNGGFMLRIRKPKKNFQY